MLQLTYSSFPKDFLKWQDSWNRIIYFTPVKYFTFIQVFIGVILFVNASAQTEHWDTYMAKFGDKPGSVLVDMGYKDAAPDGRYPFLLVTGPKAQDCNKQRLPGNEEIDRLEEILDATSNFITGVTAKVLVGTFTYDCERLNYYYVKDTMGVRNAIMRLYNRSYPNYEYAINMKADREWSTYRTFLYPGDETLNWMENDKILTKLLQQGDSLKQARDINFELYFKADTGRQAFAGFAKMKGYKADMTKVSKSANLPYELVLTKRGFVKMDAINEMTQELKNELKKYNSLYVGWDAPLQPLKK